MNNNLFKEFIVKTSNFFLKRKENIKAEKIIFVDAAFTDEYILYSVMKISFAIAENIKGELIVLPPLRENNRIRDIIKCFHPKKILAFKSLVVQGFIKNLLKMIYLFLTMKSGEDLLHYKDKNIPAGIHIYDEILRRDRLSSIERLTIRQKIYLIMSISFFYAMHDMFDRKNISYVVLPDNTYRDGLVYEIIKKKVIPSFTGIDINGLSMHKYQCSADYEHHCRTPDKSIVNNIVNDPKLNVRVEKYLNIRTEGKEKQHDVMRAYSTDKIIIDRAWLIKSYKLDASKPLILVTAHIFCDAPHGYPNMIFKDYEDWLVKTCVRLKNNRNVEFLIKEHPSTSLYKEEGIIEKILDQQGLSDRLLEKNINTKSLFTSIDALITCGGTSGMEFPCFGVPVLLGAKPPYSSFSYVVSPDSEAEYYKEIDNIHKYEKLEPENINLAKSVFYVIQVVMKVDKNKVGLGSQAYYLGCDFDFNLFMEEMVKDYDQGLGYNNLLEEVGALVNGSDKNIINNECL